MRHAASGSAFDGRGLVRATTLAVAAAVFGALAAGGAMAADAPERYGLPRPGNAVPFTPPLDLECTAIRRLADNQALDLKLRFYFNPRARTYVRMENAGRGWHLIAERPYEAFTPVKVVLAETPEFSAYVERLTGDYYHIDRTGTTLSLWGRCVPVFGFYRNF